MSITAFTSVNVSKNEGKMLILSHKLLFLPTFWAKNLHVVNLRIQMNMTIIVIVILTNPLEIIISRLDDAKPLRHCDASGHYQILIFIRVVNEAAAGLQILVAHPLQTDLLENHQS